MWLEPAELPDGCQRLSAILSTRGRALGHRRLAPRARAVRARPDHRGEDRARAAAEERSARRAHARRGGAPAQALPRAPAQGPRDAARRAKSRCSARCATRATTPAGAAAALEGPLAERLSRCRAEIPLGPRGLRGRARAPRRRARVVRARGRHAARRPPPRLEGARRAARPASGRWCASRSTACRSPPRTSRRGSTGTAARSPLRARKWAAAPITCASPARPTSTACSRPKSSATSMALPDVTHVPSEQEVAAAAEDPGLARALELIRLGIRVEGVREWLFTIRSFDDAQLLAAAELARRSAVYDRAIHTADRTSRAAQLHAALPDAVPGRVPRATRQRTASTRPGCSAWCARKAASTPMRARAPVPPA